MSRTVSPSMSPVVTAMGGQGMAGTVARGWRQRAGPAQQELPVGRLAPAVQLALVDGDDVETAVAVQVGDVEALLRSDDRAGPGRSRRARYRQAPTPRRRCRCPPRRRAARR